MITPKIILLKLLPSLIIAAAILLGMFVLAKKVETTLQTTINTYLRHEQLSQSNRNSEIDSKISGFMTVADAIARGSRFQYSVYENRNDPTSPTHYLFDSLNGEVIPKSVYGPWTLPHVPPFSNAFRDEKNSNWTKYLDSTTTYDEIRRRNNRW